MIGGGVIGGMCAWYLAKAGCEVTVVERDRFGGACSHGNCGYVSPSHVLPLSQPGAVKKTLSAMLKSNSPFAVKPRFSLTFASWFWNFARRCNQKDMLAAAQGRHELLQSSQELYKQIIADENIDCEWQEVGLLFVYPTEKEFEEFRHTDELIRDHFGVAATPYSPDELVALEPALKSGFGGAWHYQCDCHMRPDKLLTSLRDKLVSDGVRFVEETEVEEFICESSNVRAIRGRDTEIEADRFVVATGAWTPFLNKHLGCKIPIEPGKGYSLTMPTPARMPKIPMIFEETHVAITPMKTKYRIGSTMEFVGYDTSINPKRLALLRNAAEKYLHEPYCEPIEETWYGWRPMTWDGKPIIDRSPQLNNVWIAAGHNMLGLSMATGTGKLIAEMMLDETPHVDPKHFTIKRFG